MAAASARSPSIPMRRTRLCECSLSPGAGQVMVSTDGDEAAAFRRLSVKVASDERDGVVGSHPVVAPEATIFAGCWRVKRRKRYGAVVNGNFIALSRWIQ